MSLTKKKIMTLNKIVHSNHLETIKEINEINAQLDSIKNKINQLEPKLQKLIDERINVNYSINGLKTSYRLLKQRITKMKEFKYIHEGNCEVCNVKLPLQRLKENKENKLTCINCRAEGDK